MIKNWKTLEGCHPENGKAGRIQNLGFEQKPTTAHIWQNLDTAFYLLVESELMKIK